jgi:hypothetical protein
MRRRDFIQASPDESSCETRSRRASPTICSAASLSTHAFQRSPRNIHESLVDLLDRIEPFHEGQLLSLVGTCDFPTAGSWHVNTGQHEIIRVSKRICRSIRHQWRSVPIEPSSSDLQVGVSFSVTIIIHAPPENLCGQVGVARSARSPSPTAPDFGRVVHSFSVPKKNSSSSLPISGRPGGVNRTAGARVTGHEAGTSTGRCSSAEGD